MLIRNNVHVCTWNVHVYMSRICQNTYILVYICTYTSEQCTNMFIPPNAYAMYTWHVYTMYIHVYTFSEMLKHVYTFPEMYIHISTMYITCTTYYSTVHTCHIHDSDMSVHVYASW
jgi:hypothetical protein